MNAKSLQDNVAEADPIARAAVANRATVMQPNAPVIPRVTKEQFAEKYFARKLPAIVTDATSDWGEAGRWSPEFLTSLIGDKPVTVSISATGRYSYDPTGRSTSESFSEEKMSFVDAARQITDAECGRQFYVMQQSIPLQFPELMQKIRVPQWIADVKDTSINLWFGRNSVTPLHYDAANNFFAQQYGDKHFTIFAPQDSDHLYPHPIDSKMAHLSSVDVDKPNLHAHPNYSLARPIQFVVKAGELLYLPAFWWHQVRSPQVSTSVSIWWLPDLQQYVQAANGPRKLYKQYESDRLASIKKTMLVTNRLSFATAAAMLLGAGRKWAASLLALAACDEFIGSLCAKHNIPRQQGCSLRNLSTELKETLTKLAQAGIPEIQLAQTSALQKVIELASRVAQGSDGLFTAEDVGAIIKFASSLEARA